METSSTDFDFALYDPILHRLPFKRPLYPTVQKPWQGHLNGAKKAYDRGEGTAFDEKCERALEDAGQRSGQDPADLPHCMHQIAVLQSLSFHYERAAMLMADVVFRLEDIYGQEAPVAAPAYMDLGRMSLFKNDAAEAFALYDHALALYTTLGDAGGCCEVRLLQAVLTAREGHHHRARTLLAEAARDYFGAGAPDKHLLASVYLNQGVLAEAVGAIEEARERYLLAYGTAERQSPPGIWTDAVQGGFLLRHGETDWGSLSFRVGMSNATNKPVCDRPTQIFLIEHIAEEAAFIERYDLAQALAERAIALTLNSEITAHTRLSSLCLDAGYAALSQGEMEKAEYWTRAACEIAENEEGIYTIDSLRAIFCLGALLFDGGRHEEAQALLMKARLISWRLGLMGEYLPRIQELLEHIGEGPTA